MAQFLNKSFKTKNMRKIVIICFLFCFSCKNKIAEFAFDQYLVFYKTQPENQDFLKKFPIKFRGTYTESDTLFYIINEKMITTETVFKIEIKQSDRDSVIKKIKLADTNLFKIIQKSNHYFLEEKIIDTLFEISPTQVLKKLDNKLILNYKDSLYWKIQILNLDKKKLSINHIGSYLNRKKLDSISITKSIAIDSIHFLVNPSKAEMKNFMFLMDNSSQINYHKL